MLEDSFREVYTRFKLNFYEGVFSRIRERDGSLSAAEAFSLEIICALGEPTAGEFARFLGVSQSNATYKVNSLIGKGYLERRPGEDRREQRLRLTQKYYDYIHISDSYIDCVTQRIRERFSPSLAASFGEALELISDELMPETDWYAENAHRQNKTATAANGGNMEKMASKVIISADRTCDLSDDLLKRYDIRTMPYHILLDGQEYLDNVDIFSEDIFKAYREKRALPKTSAINVGEYLDFFTPLVNEGYEVVHINLAGALSSSGQNCAIAASELKGVWQINSRTLSTGTGLLAIRASELRDGGATGAEIAQALEEMSLKSHASFILDTLEYMAAGGRCSTVTALGANLLRLKPCIEVVNDNNGAMSVGKKYRGEFATAVTAYVRDRLAMYDNIRTDRAFITHSGGKVITPEIIELVRATIRECVNFDEVFETRAACTITSHCGPGTLGVLFMTD